MGCVAPLGATPLLHIPPRCVTPHEWRHQGMHRDHLSNFSKNFDEDLKRTHFRPGVMGCQVPHLEFLVENAMRVEL